MVADRHDELDLQSAVPEVLLPAEMSDAKVETGEQRKQGPPHTQGAVGEQKRRPVQPEGPWKTAFNAIWSADLARLMAYERKTAKGGLRYDFQIEVKVPDGEWQALDVHPNIVRTYVQVTSRHLA